MAITQTPLTPNLQAQFGCGTYKDDAGSPGVMTIALGFQPKYIRVVNVTTRVEFEWFDSLPATQNLKTVAAGTRTLDATSAIVPVSVSGQKANGDDPALPAVYESFTFAAANIAQNDLIAWQAMA